MSESIEESMRRTIEAVCKRAERAETELARLKAKQASKKKGPRWEFCRATYWDPRASGGEEFQELVDQDRREFDDLLKDGWQPQIAWSDHWYTWRTFVFMKRRNRG